jgi:TonB family protein
MKTCPTCHRNYDNEMKFCLDDGSVLVAETASGMTTASGVDATLHLPGHSTEQPPTAVKPPQTSPQQATIASAGVMPASGPAPAGANVAYAGMRRGSNALMWLGAALIIGIAAIAVAVALLITRTRKPSFESVGPEAAASPSETGSDPTKIVAVEAPTIGAPPSASRTPLQKGVVSTVNPAPKGGTTIVGVPGGTASDAPPPPPPLAKPPAVISGGVLNGKAIRLVTPAYPAIAKAAHASGQVKVQVLIDENGNVVSASAVSGHPLLQASAISAAKASKFTPTKLTGQPVKVSGVIIYNFVAQ